MRIVRALLEGIGECAWLNDIDQAVINSNRTPDCNRIGILRLKPKVTLSLFLR